MDGKTPKIRGLCCTGASTVPGTGAGAGTGYDISQKTKVRVP